MDDYKKIIATIPDEKKADYIRNNWLSHDARWQIEVVKNYGWEAGNKLNHTVAEDIGKVMMFRMMKSLGIKKVSNVNELINILLSVVKVSFPPPNSLYEIKIDSRSTLRLRCQKCPTHEKIVKAGATDFYDCGCFSLRKGFFNALNLTLEQEKHACLIDGDEECNITLRIKEWENILDINPIKEKTQLLSD
ncbi:MAG: hypothetical protein ACFFAS_12920 [Promethearchaeota archaeon]